MDYSISWINHQKSINLVWMYFISPWFTGDRNVSSHSVGNGRFLLAIHLGFFSLTRSSESEQELQRYREDDPLQNHTAQYCSAAASKVHCQMCTVHRNSYIEASVTFTQHLQCAQTQRHCNWLYSKHQRNLVLNTFLQASAPPWRGSLQWKGREMSFTAAPAHLCTLQTQKRASRT